MEMNEADIAPQFMTRAEAANYLRLSIRKLDYLAESGELEFVKLGKSRAKGARVLYRRGDLDRYVEENLFRNPSEEEIRQGAQRIYERD